jgi:hypothetical protein
MAMTLRYLGRINEKAKASRYISITTGYKDNLER